MRENEDKHRSQDATNHGGGTSYRGENRQSLGKGFFHRTCLTKMVMMTATDGAKAPSVWTVSLILLFDYLDALEYVRLGRSRIARRQPRQLIQDVHTLDNAPDLRELSIELHCIRP